MENGTPNTPERRRRLNFSTVPPWALERSPYPVEVAPHQLPRGLGINRVWLGGGGDALRAEKAAIEQDVII
jgi:hypothetical protein